MKLEDLLDRVKDHQTFLEFARALQADKADEDQKENENPSEPFSPGWNGWENNTIAGFLEAAIAWAEDSDFGNKTVKPDNLWKEFALFLYGGKIYE